MRLAVLILLTFLALPGVSQDTVHELVKRAIFKAQIQDYPAALQDLDAAIRLDSTQSEPWYNRGIIETEMKDYPAALKDFNTAIRIHPTYPEPYVGMAFARSALGDHSAAILAYNKAISLRPEDSGPYYRRGLEFLEVANWHDAILDFTRVTHLEPGNADAWYNLGLAFFKDGQYPRADSALLESSRLDSLSVETWITLGASKGAQGRFDDALQYLDHALSIQPDSPDGLYNKALVLLFLKRFQEALPVFDAAIKADSGNPSAWEGRGVARQYTGDVTGACADWKQASLLGSGRAAEYLKKYCSN